MEVMEIQLICMRCDCVHVHLGDWRQQHQQKKAIWMKLCTQCYFNSTNTSYIDTFNWIKYARDNMYWIPLMETGSALCVCVNETCIANQNKWNYIIKLRRLFSTSFDYFGIANASKNLICVRLSTFYFKSNKIPNTKQSLVFIIKSQKFRFKLFFLKRICEQFIWPHLILITNDVK